MIKVHKFTFNPLQENTYVLYDETGECIIVDAGCYFNDEREELVRFIGDAGLRPVKLVNTHCHFDHILGITFCRTRYNIPFGAHRDDEFLIKHAVTQGEVFGVPLDPVDPPDEWISEGDPVNFGNSQLETIHVPGHGDVLFQGSIGRTDLPKGSYEQLIGNIQVKLFALPDDTIVYCGHGPETSIGEEKEHNPFLSHG